VLSDWELVALAETYSTEDSGRFVNGILGRIADCTSSRT
jgi:transcription termination factor NusB